MFSVSKTFSFCYGHRLMHDEGKCRHLHGHTAKTTIILKSSELDQKGMVVHFDRMKETIGKWIEENLDHTLLLADGDPLTKLLEKNGEKFRTVGENPTAENIAKMIFGAAKSFNLPVTKVEVWESETSKACFEE